MTYKESYYETYLKEYKKVYKRVKGAITKQYTQEEFKAYFRNIISTQGGTVSISKTIKKISSTQQLYKTKTLKNFTRYINENILQNVKSRKVRTSYIRKLWTDDMKVSRQNLFFNWVENWLLDNPDMIAPEDRYRYAREAFDEAFY